MAQIKTCQVEGRELLLVRYSVDMGPQLTDRVFADDGRRLALALHVASGAWVSEPRCVGSTSITGLREDEMEHYECVLEPNAANVSALLAAGFAWEDDASQFAQGPGIRPEMVAKTREAIEAAIAKERSELLKLLETAKHQARGSKRSWQFWRS